MIPFPRNLCNSILCIQKYILTWLRVKVRVFVKGLKFYFILHLKKFFTILNNLSHVRITDNSDMELQKVSLLFFDSFAKY